ncbi:C-X-C motif chemokine 10-like [Polyodon spathula]|uniref:C-X-C motif chemokine 10-like n=1 Tax=Polyodon spathula TaxID=7913 RepID=UPI001B7F704B|nr:C-X-C motif chemokine 10-like [Polyodon spathula]
MNSTATLFFISFVLCAAVEGTSLYGKGRCICLKNGDDFVRGRNIVKLEVIPKSPMCDRLEIIVTMKGTAEQRCLNPQSKFVQNLVSTLRTRYSK